MSTKIDNDALQVVGHTPTTAKSTDDVVVVNGLPLLIHADIAASALGGGYRRNIIATLAAETGVAFSEGDQLYWDGANSRLTATAGANVFIGTAHADKASATATAAVDFGSNRPAGGSNLGAFRLSIDGGAAADDDWVARVPLTVVDVIAQHTGGAGEASDTLQLKDGDDNAISDALDWSGADNAIVRAGTIDDAYATLAVGDTLRVTTVDDDSGSDVGAGVVTVIALIG